MLIKYPIFFCLLHFFICRLQSLVSSHFFWCNFSAVNEVSSVQYLTALNGADFSSVQCQLTNTANGIVQQLLNGCQSLLL